MNLWDEYDKQQVKIEASEEYVMCDQFLIYMGQESHAEQTDDQLIKEFLAARLAYIRLNPTLPFRMSFGEWLDSFWWDGVEIGD